MEFKAKHGLFSKVLLPGINRIRLEFKVWSFEGFNIAIYVLIESDWNLKLDDLIDTSEGILVLIESDWNLKLHGKAAFCETGTVLIESDWNLKEKYSPIFAEEAIVLIESDWNLKVCKKA